MTSEILSDRAAAAAPKNMEQLYQERLARYTAALRNGMPDRVPVRPFAAEVTARYAGYTDQQVTHDYRFAFDAILKCCRDFNWDATVPNMVYVWTGLTEMLGLRYYGVPGIHVPHDVGFQYREPTENEAFMRQEEYDELIEDPTRFLYEVWLPRVTQDIGAKGASTGYRGKLSLVRGSMAMLNYFNAFGPHVERMRIETGTPCAIAGILKAPLDILADKLRGYVGLVYDLKEVPEKVLAACYALMPHLAHVAATTADPNRQIPVSIWMHRGCVPFISMRDFETFFWPTLRPIMDYLWERGIQVLFYAEGNWDAHLERFAELPAGSIVYHMDRANPKRVQEALGKKFCLSGGVPNDLLMFGSEDDVRAKCKWLIETCGAEGGYCLDASAIMQNDTTIPNLRAMTNSAAEFGVYRSPSSPTPKLPEPGPAVHNPIWDTVRKPAPGVCWPWEDKVKELPPLSGDADLTRRIWEENDALGHMFIWQVLLSF